MEIDASFILETVDQYRVENNLYDCTIIVDGQIFKATKSHLCACSEFFRQALTPAFKELKETESHLFAFSESLRQVLSTDSKVVIKGIKPEIFRIILRAIVTGKLLINQTNMIDIWFASCYLKVIYLPRMCEEYIEKNLSLENYLFLHDEALTMGCMSVSTKLSTLIASDCIRFSATHYFLNKPSDFILDTFINGYPSDNPDDLIRTVYAWLNHEVKGEVADYTFQPYADIEEVRNRTFAEDINVYKFTREHVVKFVTRRLSLAQDRESTKHEVVEKLLSVVQDRPTQNLAVQQMLNSLNHV